MSPLLENHLHEEDAAVGIGKTPRTMQSWRPQGIGPPYVKIGKTVYYERAALLGWLKDQQVVPVRSRRRAQPQHMTT
jgi:hypothetical protein